MAITRTALISSNALGDEGSGRSSTSSISGDGRLVAFLSAATDFGFADANGIDDTFVKNVDTGTITLISSRADGTAAGSHGNNMPQISQDGRFVTFTSMATDLAPEGANGAQQVYVKDLQTGATVLASRDAAGMQSSGNSIFPSVSADGRFVAFQSYGPNTSAGDATNTDDVFVKDTASGTLTLASVGTGGVQGDGVSQAPTISADGRFVVFSSFASNFANDTNGAPDVFLKDLATGTLTLVSANSTGAAASTGGTAPAISADGRYVAFISAASDLVPGEANGRGNVVVKDMQTGEARFASVAADGTRSNGNSNAPSLSADGRFVAFQSDASNLVAGDGNGTEDIFVKDMQTGAIALASVSTAGAAGNGVSYQADISADGQTVTFSSSASDLVAGDTNGLIDVFAAPVRFGPPSPPAFSGALSVNDVSADEGDPLTFTALLSQSAPAGGVSVRYVTSDGTAAAGSDYVAANGTLTFSEGETSKTFTVASTEETLVEPDETFTVTLSNPSIGTIADGSGTATLRNDDAAPPKLVPAAVTSSGGEEGQSYQFGVFLLGKSATPVTIDYQTADGTAIAGSDYMPQSGRLTFAPGEDTKFIYIQTIEDTIVEPDEVMYVRYTNPVGLVLDTTEVPGLVGNDDFSPAGTGTAGKDNLSGTNAGEAFRAGKGDDKIKTGGGNDVIFFNPGDGRDEVTDFERGADRVQLGEVRVNGERIDTFAELQALARVSADKKSITVAFDGGDALTLTGVTTLAQGDWVFS